MNKFEKLLRILSRPQLALALAKGTPPGMEHLQALAGLNVRSCIDVGACYGQFSVLCQELFGDIRIFAFEPLADAAERCRRVLPASANVYQFALGATERQSEFHVTNKPNSSSLLVPGRAQFEAYGVKQASRVDVKVRRLDNVLTKADLDGRCLLKIDVQGGELDVLRGCGELLNQIEYIYLEGSFVELYDGQPLITDIVVFLSQWGFVLRGIYNNSFTDQFGDTQGDFLFTRKTPSLMQHKSPAAAKA